MDNTLKTARDLAEKAQETRETVAGIVGRVQIVTAAARSAGAAILAAR